MCVQVLGPENSVARAALSCYTQLPSNGHKRRNGPSGSIHPDKVKGLAAVLKRAAGWEVSALRISRLVHVPCATLPRMAARLHISHLVHVPCAYFVHECTTLPRMAAYHGRMGTPVRCALIAAH